MEGEQFDRIRQYLLQAGVTDEKINGACGHGIKRLALSEQTNYERTNRSLHYVHSMKKGEIIKEDDIVVVRTEKVLSVGLSPQLKDVVINARLQKDVGEGDGISFDDIVAK